MQSIPVIIRPESLVGVDSNPASLCQWAAANRPTVDKQLQSEGALLFRGFEFESAEQFHDLTKILADDLLSYERGATPRKKVKDKIYTSTEASQRVPIPLHCEMSSYGRTAPAKIFFFCEQPAKKQGQTPIANMADMYAELDPGVRERFESRGLRMIQNVPEKRSFKTLGATKTWLQMFETDSRDKVDQYCLEQGVAHRWKEDGSVQLINECDPVIIHPQRNEKIWFNSAHNFYPSWSWEMQRVKSRIATWIFKYVENRMVKKLAPEDRPYYVTYLDGGEIDPQDILHIREHYWKHARMFDWEAGDVLYLDNLRFAHGRMPYSGFRRVLAVIADPWQKVSSQTVSDGAQLTDHASAAKA